MTVGSSLEISIKRNLQNISEILSSILGEITCKHHRHIEIEAERRCL